MFLSNEGGIIILLKEGYKLLRIFVFKKGKIQINK